MYLTAALTALIAAVLASPIAAVPATAQPADATSTACRSTNGSEIITRQEIEHAGFARLSDVFLLVDRWSTATIDGYTRHAQASGLSPLTNPRWDVLIDGIPAEIGLLGTQSLDALPISLSEVECVEFIARPHVGAGELREAGQVRIRTRRPQSGMTMAGAVAARNEVNDPGPFAYTPLASRNVDRIGPIGTATIEIRSRGRFARLAGKIDEFHFTDDRVDLRAKQLYITDSKPRINTLGISLSGGLDTRWGSQRVVAGRSETDDLLFFEPYGMEIPAIRMLDFAGAAGSLRLGSGELRYHGSYIRHEFVERENELGLDLDFGKRIFEGGAESRVGAGPILLSVGGSFESVEALTTQPIIDRTTITTRIFGRIEGAVEGLLEASLFGSWIQVDEQPGYSAAPALSVTLPHGAWLAATASMSRRSLASDATLWRWTQFGYELPQRNLHEDDSLFYVPPAGVVRDLRAWPAPTQFTADLDVGGSVPLGIDYVAGGYFRRTTNDYLPDHDIAFSTATTAFLTKTTLFNEGSGEILGFHASIGVGLVPGFSQRLTYVTESAVSGDRLFEREQARVPSHRLSLTASFSPNDRFNVTARARYSAATTWTDYAAASHASQAFYLWRLPEYVLLDVAATKRFWRDHVTANISIRNLLNEPYRGHPAAAIFNMSFHFAVQVSFNSESGL